MGRERLQSMEMTRLAANIRKIVIIGQSSGVGRILQFRDPRKINQSTARPARPTVGIVSLIIRKMYRTAVSRNIAAKKIFVMDDPKEGG